MGGDHPRNLRPPGSRGGPHLALITKEILPPETVRIRGFANRLCRRTALEPDPSVSFWCLRRLLLGWLTLRRLVQVLYATPLLSANSSWLITAPCRMRRKRGRSMLCASKTLQRACIKPTTMLRYLSIACRRI